MLPGSSFYSIVPIVFPLFSRGDTAGAEAELNRILPPQVLPVIRHQ